MVRQFLTIELVYLLLQSDESILKFEQSRSSVCFFKTVNKKQVQERLNQNTNRILLKSFDVKLFTFQRPRG